MKFLVDAQLPRRLAHEIVALGNDAIHTLDLPTRNLTTDSAITQKALAEDRTIVTKDRDFVAQLSAARGSFEAFLYNHREHTEQ